MRPTFPTEYLYVRTSGLRAFNEATQDYDKIIGRGLFTAARIPKGYIICEFIGDVITTEENNLDSTVQGIRTGLLRLQGHLPGLHGQRLQGCVRHSQESDGRDERGTSSSK